MAVMEASLSEPKRLHLKCPWVDGYPYYPAGKKKDDKKATHGSFDHGTYKRIALQKTRPVVFFLRINWKALHPIVEVSASAQN